MAAEVASNEDTAVSELDEKLLNNEVFRDHLVETAIKFLTSPKILGFDEEKKINFLEKKGLTKAEIDSALSRSQKLVPVSPVYAENIEAIPQYQLAKLPQLQPPAIPPRRGFWSFLRGSANIFIFLSGIAYGVHYLYKYYIGPYLTGRRPKSNEEIFFEVHQSVMSVLQQIQNTLEKMDNNISSHNHILKEITSSENIINRMKNNSAIEEIQKELNNIKGLLINKKTFPASPQVTPAIPHWQRMLKKDEEIIPPVAEDDIKALTNGDLSISTNQPSEREGIDIKINEEEESSVTSSDEAA